MVENPLIHLSLEEEDRGFLSYTRGVLDRLGSSAKATFFYVKEEGLSSLNFLTPKPEEEGIARRMDALVKDYFEHYELKIVRESVEDFLRSWEYQWLFLRYRRTFFRKALHERVIQSLDHLKLWIYKGGGVREPKEICAPIDLSNRSKRQVEFALSLAERFDARIRLIYALSISRMRSKVNQSEYESLRSVKEEEAKHVYADVLHTADLPLELIDGDPIKDLPKHINQQDCHLIVISRRSRQEVRPVGRTSLHIIRSVKCPVVVL